MSGAAKPPIIKQFSLVHDYDLNKVWKLDTPATEMNLEELLFHFDVPFWNRNGPDTLEWNLAPWEVIKNPEAHPQRYQRILQADLDFAVDLIELNDFWLVLDGLHRLAKAYIEGRTTIKVRKTPGWRVEEIKMCV